MVNLLNRNNKHLFLEKPDKSDNSFIANINSLSKSFRGLTSEDVLALKDIPATIVSTGEEWKLILEETALDLLAGATAFNTAIVTKITEDVPANSEITLPNIAKYVVGTNMLMLSYNGTVCYLGEQFEEIGESNTDSNKIKILFDLRTDDILEFRVIALNANVSNSAVIAEDSTEPRTLAERFSDIINVKDFGAKGDGVHDDTEAFIIAASKGSPIYVPDGNYKLPTTPDNMNAVLTAAGKMYGEGSVLVTLPSGVFDIDTVELFCHSNLQLKICGTTPITQSLSNVNVTFSGTPGYYTASVTLPSVSGIQSGMVISFRQTSKFATNRCILNGAYRITSVNENTVTFPVHYHSAAYPISSFDYTGSVTVYSTTMKTNTVGTLFENHANCKCLVLKNIGLCGSHIYGETEHNNSVAIADYDVSSDTENPRYNISLDYVGITEFGVGAKFIKSSIMLNEVHVGNCNYGIEVTKSAIVRFFGTLGICECSLDGLFIDLGGRVYGFSRAMLNGNTKRGLWCHGSSEFFSSESIYTCYNAVAGVYAKSGATVYVGQQSAASYNLTTDANDCPGYGAEDHSFIMAYGSYAYYNGGGYCPGGNSTIDATESTADSNRDNNFYALVGSVIEAARAISIGSQYGFSSQEGSTIRCKNADISRASKTGLIANRNSEIRCDYANIHDNNVGVESLYNSDIHAPGATISNNTVDYKPGRNGTAYIGSTLYPSYFTPSEGDLLPVTDNVQKCGNASYRWSNIYAATGSVQTSDKRSKTSINDINESLMKAWSKVSFKAFQFIDAVEKKGSEEARIHFGIIAQQVKKAFESEGLDVSRYALFCYDEWEDEYEDVEIIDAEATYDENGNEISPVIKHTEKKLVTPAGNRYGIRYSEALCLEAAYQRRENEKLKNELANLQIRLNAIESKLGVK